MTVPQGALDLPRYLNNTQIPARFLLPGPLTDKPYSMSDILKALIKMRMSFLVFNSWPTLVNAPCLLAFLQDPTLIPPYDPNSSAQG